MLILNQSPDIIEHVKTAEEVSIDVQQILTR